MERKEQSDNTKNNNDAKTMKLPIFNDHISVEKVDKAHKKKSKKRKNNKRNGEKENNIFGTSSNPKRKESNAPKDSSNPKSKESNAPKDSSNPKSKEGNSSDETRLSTTETNLINSHSKTALSNNKIIIAPKITFPENATAKERNASCDSANENKINGTQKETKSSQKGATGATVRKLGKRRSGFILGDSMVKHVYGWELKERCGDDCNAYVKNFPGAITKDMYSYSQPTIERKHDIAILHVGTNDLATRKSEVEISQGIIDLAEHIKSHDIEVAVSGIIARGKNI